MSEAPSRSEHEELGIAVYPDAYAAFLAGEGWIIRRSAHGLYLPLTADRKETAQEAWEDLSRKLAREVVRK